MLRDEPANGGSMGTHNPTQHRVTVAVIGAGQRGRVYAEYALTNPDKMKVVAVADPRPHRLGVMGREHQVPQELRFTDWKTFVERGRIADAVAICVLDDLHAEVVKECSRLGYHILCEKPMATKVADCVQMVQDVREQPGLIFGMGHVLRYSPYNVAVKEIIDSGALGEIINIQHIEPVGNQHFSHSYVRGNWHKEADASFSLMAKCCHDIDILSFYLSGLPPVKVHSFGSIGHFKPSKQPKEAKGATRCLECPIQESCVWSAKKIYIEPLASDKNRDRWAKHIVDADVPDIENVTEALRTGPYGRCVYHAGNDVVDHQVVNIEYEGGVTASMTMSAFTEAECDRSTVIHGTKGELRGDMMTFTVFDFLTRTRKTHTPRADGGMHGGGDLGLSRAFIDAVASKDQTKLGVTPDDVLNSHLLVFAAEKARREEKVVRFAEFKKGAMAGKVVF